MMDHFGDMPGPTKEAAFTIVKEHFYKRKQDNHLDFCVYVTNGEIESITETYISNKFPTQHTIGSVAGWAVFHKNDIISGVHTLLLERNKLNYDYKVKTVSIITSLNSIFPSEILAQF